MLKIVVEALRELGLLSGQTRPEIHICITKGDTIWVRVFASPRLFFHVKATEFFSLGAEFEANRRARNIFHELVPVPLGYVARNGWDILIMEGMDYRPVSADAILSAGPDVGLAKSISGFFLASMNAALPYREENTHSCFLQALADYFSNTSFVQVLEPWLRGAGRSDLESLHSIPQHGDFVPNNLGTVNSSIVIFDWEDFGKLNLPGFDLCTLTLAVARHDADRLKAFMRGERVFGEGYLRFLGKSCEALALDITLFRKLIPLYLLGFYYLKRNYGTGVKDRVGKLLQQIMA